MNAYQEEEYNKRFDLGLWKRIFKFTLPHWKTLFWLIVSVAITSGIDIVVPLMSRTAIDKFITPGTTEGLGGFIAIYFALIVAQALAIALFIMMADKMAIMICYDVRKQGFHKLQQLSFSYYDLTPVGNIMARMTSDVNRLSDIIGWGITDVLMALIFGIGVLVSMFALNLTLALLVMTVVPIIILASIYFQRRILKNHRAVRRINSRITGSFNEGIMGARTTKTLVREEVNLSEFQTLTTDMRKSSIHAAVLSAMYMPIITSLGAIASGIVLWWGGGQVALGSLSYGTLAAFISYASSFFDPIRQLAGMFAEMQSAQAAGERVMTLLDTPLEIKDSKEIIEKYGDSFFPKRENWETIKGDIKFDNVTFAYKGGEKVLENFNLDVKAGQTIAIVGETGSGKSTIVNLVCRFYEPTEGKILIDGTDYRERSQLWLQSNLGYVLQAPHLFSGTIKDNIRYAKLDATDEEIERAAQLVHADGFISKLENGFDTEVGEGGGRLSTGEKQLISFARAILADPRIFVLDEATSSIDTETEQLIQHAIQTVLSGRTSFIIAHRLSTVRSADRILVIDDGKIIEEGTHEQLIRKRGYYYELYTNQFKEEKTQAVLG